MSLLVLAKLSPHSNVVASQAASAFGEFFQVVHHLIALLLLLLQQLANPVHLQHVLLDLTLQHIVAHLRLGKKPFGVGKLALDSRQLVSQFPERD